MYRNNQTKRFKTSLMQIESETSAGSQGSPNIRTTAQILSLFNKTADNDNEEMKENVVSKESIKSANKESFTPVSANDNKLRFNVVIGKMSTRKHKKWDDDGILEVNGRSAVIKDSDGNILHRTVVNPASLEEGFSFSVGNKDVQIVDRIFCDIESTNAETKAEVEEPTKKRPKISKTPFNSVRSKKDLGLTYNPLVMPPLYDSRNWLKTSNLEKEMEVSVDACLVNVLRPHQRYGVVFLYECLMGRKVPNYYGAILADEMGLGKTLQCITIIWTLLKKGPNGQPVIKRALIVTPSSLCNNWNKEFMQWLGYHRICPYVVNAKNKVKDFKKQPRNWVMIISYDMLIRSTEEIEDVRFDLIICDEGHRLKNNDVKAAKFLYNLPCKRRVLLTGTPIQNDLQEFFSLIDFVNPGILGSSHEYKVNYGNPIVASRNPDATEDTLIRGKEKAEELQRLTKSFILRRTQNTINEYLPSKHEVVVLCQLSPDQIDLYTLVTEAWFRSNMSSGNSLLFIQSLKKICNHASLFTAENNESFHYDSISLSKIQQIKRTAEENVMRKYCGKMSIVRALMKELKQTDEKLVLVSYYTKTLDVLENICNMENLSFLRLDGSTPLPIRTKIVERFNTTSDNHKVFLLSGKAGGVGLNLPGASRLILFDSDWNPASDAQAMARIWREGQKKDVYTYRLLTTGTIEEKIFQRQISKTGLSETVVDEHSFASLKFSLIELKDLFSLTTNTFCLTHDLMQCTCQRNGRTKEPIKEVEMEEKRECQLFLEDKPVQPNITINQLLDWEHYEQPIPNEILKEIMLTEVRENITFIFKNSYSKLRSRSV